MGAECGSRRGCRVESLVSVDERGQMILPKALRDRVKIKPGDKLVVVSWKKNGGIYCLSLVKADNFRGMLASLLGPMVKEISEVVRE